MIKREIQSIAANSYLRRIQEKNERLGLPADTGMDLCVHSFEFGRACGTVVGTQQVVKSGSFGFLTGNITIIINLPGRWPCTTAQGTDIAGVSGGPVTNLVGKRAVGMIWGCKDAVTIPCPGGNECTTVRLYASKIRNIENDLGVDVLVAN